MVAGPRNQSSLSFVLVAWAVFGQLARSLAIDTSGSRAGARSSPWCCWSIRCTRSICWPRGLGSTPGAVRSEIRRPRRSASGCDQRAGRPRSFRGRGVADLEGSRQCGLRRVAEGR